MSKRLSTISSAMLGYPDWQNVLEVILEEFGCQTGTLHQWADLRQTLKQ